MRAGLGRDFAYFWFGETTSRLGTSVTGIALPLVAVTIVNANTLLVTLLTAATWVPWLLIGLPAGAWIDRWPLRPIMLACNGVSTVALASVPVAAWLHVLTMAQLLLVALVAGVVAVFFSTAYQVFVPTIVTREQVPTANARLQGSESAAEIAGPGLAGLLAQLLGVASALLADAVSFLVSTACLLTIRTRQIRPAAAIATSLYQQVVDGLRFLRQDRFLRPMTLYSAACNLTLTAVQAIGVVFLVRDVRLSAGAVGGLMALAGTGGIVGAVLVNRVVGSYGSARGLLLCELCTTPFSLLLPLTGNGARLLFFLVGYSIVAAGLVASNVIVGSFRQTYCPPRLLGRITASVRFINYGTIPVGAVLGGALGTAIGNRPTLSVMTSGLVLSGLILLISPVSRRRDLPRSAEPEAAAASPEGAEAAAIAPPSEIVKQSPPSIAGAD